MGETNEIGIVGANMLKLDTILEELNINHSSIGNTEFESMGLLGSDYDGKLCSFIVDIKYENLIRENASVLLVTKEVAKTLDADNMCIVDDPRYVFFLVHNYISNRKEYKRNDYDTVIGEGSVIHKLAYIADKNVTIGNNVIIEEFVSIKENVTIGDNCIIRAGSIIGGEGFEQKRHDELILGIKHLGGVVIGDNVELQQSNCVDKAIYPWDNTEIGDYCKTDNKVHIAHAVKMRKRVLIAACTCVAGRVIIEDDVWIGPGVTLINGMHIGKGARVNIGSVATKDVDDNCSVTGNFAIEHNTFINNLRKIRNG